MGADLYFTKLPREAQYTGFQTNVSVGYFRDAYNNSNLLWQFDLDYWIKLKKYLNEDYIMTVANVIKFKEELKKREPVFEQNMADLLEFRNKVWDFNGNKLEPDTKLTLADRKKWVKNYKAYYKTLKEFLDKAIELNTTIECSI